MPSTDTQEGAAGKQDLDKDLLALLVCPETKAPLVYDRKRGELVSKQAGLAYPVIDGVPILLKDRARRLDAHE